MSSSEELSLVLDEIDKNLEFKRKVVFSLRTYAQLVSPTNRHAVENVQLSLERVTEQLLTIIRSFGDESEFVMLVGRIYHSLCASIYHINALEPSIRVKLSELLLDITVSALALQDESLSEIVQMSWAGAEKAKIIEASGLGDQALDGIAKVSAKRLAEEKAMKESTFRLLLKMISITSSTCIDTLCKGMAVESILNHLDAKTDLSPDVKITALQIACLIIKNGGTQMYNDKQSMIQTVVKLLSANADAAKSARAKLDEAKSSAAKSAGSKSAAAASANCAKLQDIGADILSELLTIDEINLAFQRIAGGQEVVRGVTVLRGIHFLKATNLKFQNQDLLALADLISNTAGRASSATLDVDSAFSLACACLLLSSALDEKGKDADALIERLRAQKGLSESIIKVLPIISSDVEDQMNARSSILRLLTHVCNPQFLAFSLQSDKTFAGAIVNSLKCDDPCPALTLLSSVGAERDPPAVSQKDLADIYQSLGLVDVVSHILREYAQAPQANHKVALCALKCLQNAPSGSQTMLQAAATVLSVSESPEACELALSILEKNLGKPMSKTATGDKSGAAEGVVSSLVGMKIRDAKALTRARDLLGKCATVADCKAAVAELEKCVDKYSTAKSDDALEKALRAVELLSTIDALKPHLLQAQCQQALMKGASALLAAGKADLLNICLNSISVLSAGPGQEASADHATSGEDRAAMALKLINLLNGPRVTRQTADDGGAAIVSILSLVEKWCEEGCYSVRAEGADRGKMAPNSTDNSRAMESRRISEALKALDGLSGVMRKYPENRRAITSSIRVMEAIIRKSSGAELADGFLKSGISKQVFNYTNKALPIEELQILNLKLMLSACERSVTVATSLQNSGAIEIVKDAVRTHPSSSIIKDLSNQLLVLLTPESMAREETTQKLASLTNAAKNGDLSAGANALDALAALTVAADAAKHAGKSGVAEAIHNFFVSTRLLGSSGAKPAASDAETINKCSLDAIQILENVAKVGKPYSTILAKNNAIVFILAILKDHATESPADSMIQRNALIALQALLSQEKNPRALPGSPEAHQYLIESLPMWHSKPHLLFPALACISLSGDNVQASSVAEGIGKTAKALEQASTEQDRVQWLKSLNLVFRAEKKDLAKKNIEVFSNAGGCSVTMDLLNKFGDTEMGTAIECRKILERAAVLNPKAVKLDGERAKSGFRKLAKEFGRNIGMIEGDAEAARISAVVLTNLSTKMDLEPLEKSNLMQQAVEIMKIHPESRELQAAIGDLMMAIGAEDQVDDLFGTVLRLLKDRPSDFEKQLLETLQRLEAFIPCSSSRMKKAFVKAPEAMTALGSFLSEAKKSSDFLESISAVALHLFNRFDGSIEARDYSAVALMPGFIPKLVKFIVEKDPGCKAKKSKIFLTNSYNLLDRVLLEQLGHKSLRGVSSENEPPKAACETPLGLLVQQEGLLPESWRILEANMSDAMVSSTIARFLARFGGTDKKSVECVEEAKRQSGVRELPGDGCNALFDIIFKSRKVPNGLDECLECFGGYAAMQKQNPVDFLTSKSVMQGMIKIMEESVSGQIGVSLLATRVAQHLPEGEGHEFFDDILKMAVKQWKAVKHDENVRVPHKTDLLRSTALLTTVYANKRRFAAIKEEHVPSVLLDGIKFLQQQQDQQGAIDGQPGAGGDLDVHLPGFENHLPEYANHSSISGSNLIRDFAETMMTLSKEQHEYREFTLTKGIPAVLSDGANVIHSDPLACLYTLETALDLVTASPEAAAFLRNVIGAQEALEAALKMSESRSEGADLPESVFDNLQTVAMKLKQLLSESKSYDLTIEMIHMRWQTKQESGDVLTLSQRQGLDLSIPGLNGESDEKIEGNVDREFEFIVTKMKEYSISDELGNGTKNFVTREFICGCFCLQMLLDYAGNLQAVIDSPLPDTILLTASRLNNQLVVQYIIHALVDLTKYPEGARRVSAIGHPEGTELDEDATDGKGKVRVTEHKRRIERRSGVSSGYARDIALDLLEKGYSWRPSPEMTMQYPKFLSSRIELMGRLAVDRYYYDGTEALRLLAKIWYDIWEDEFVIRSDEDTCVPGGDTVLLALGLCMRNFISWAFLDDFLATRIPDKIIEYLNSKSSPSKSADSDKYGDKVRRKRKDTATTDNGDEALGDDYDESSVDEGRIESKRQEVSRWNVLSRKKKLSIKTYQIQAELLFSLGLMATHSSVKNRIADLEGIETIVDLLKGCQKIYKQNNRAPWLRIYNDSREPSGLKSSSGLRSSDGMREGSSVDFQSQLLSKDADEGSSVLEYGHQISRCQQNACLTLGTASMGHGRNANSFGNSGGVDLSVDILQVSMKDGRRDYDLANAAALLITNVCFKRDDFKTAYGQKGASEAALTVLKKYDGIRGDNIERSLISVFKCIGNLVLLPANVDRLLTDGVTDVLKRLLHNLANAGGQSADPTRMGWSEGLILICLKTMSNLLLENSEVFMEEFGQLIGPILELFSSGINESSGDGKGPINRAIMGSEDIVVTILEILTFLCRHQANIKMLISDKRSNGIRLVLDYLNSMRSEKIYDQGLSLLAVLAASPVAAHQLIEMKCFTFILGLLDEATTLSPDIILNGLKVIRRLLSQKNRTSNRRVSDIAGPADLQSQTTDRASEGRLGLIQSDARFDHRRASDCRRLAEYAAETFIGTSPLPLLCDVLVAASKDSGLSGPHIASECLKVLVLLLELYPAPYGGVPDHNRPVLMKAQMEARRQFKFESTRKMKTFGKIFKSFADGHPSVAFPSSSEASEFDDDDDDEDEYSTKEEEVPGPINNVYTPKGDGMRDLDGSPVDLNSPFPVGTVSSHVPENEGFVLYKPRSPRAYERIGLDMTRGVTVCAALVRMLIMQETLRVDTLSELSVFFIAYCCAEKFDGILSAFASDALQPLPAPQQSSGGRRESVDSARRRGSAGGMVDASRWPFELFMIKCLEGARDDGNSAARASIVKNAIEGVLCNGVCLMTVDELLRLKGSSTFMTALKDAARDLKYIKDGAGGRTGRFNSSDSRRLGSNLMETSRLDSHRTRLNSDLRSEQEMEDILSYESTDESSGSTKNVYRGFWMGGSQKGSRERKDSRMRTESLTETRRKLDEVYALLHTSDDEMSCALFFKLCTNVLEYDTDRIIYERYPNGVQDLDMKLRKKIRKGGQCKVVDLSSEPPKLIPCIWKASNDLSNFEWMSDPKRELYDNRVPMARVRCFERGFNTSPSLKSAGATLKLSPVCCISMIASQAGPEMLFVFPTRLHAGQFFGKIGEWHKAATF